MAEKRHHARIPMKCKVKIQHPGIGELFVESRDLSDNGIFLLADNIEGLKIGDVVKGQVQGMMEEAPTLDMVVVRREPSGIGLRFCEE